MEDSAQSQDHKCSMEEEEEDIILTTKRNLMVDWVAVVMVLMGLVMSPRLIVMA
jgi:hypothetical protein